MAYDNSIMKCTNAKIKYFTGRKICNFIKIITIHKFMIPRFISYRKNI